METHLREGCPDCVEAHRLWQGMATFADAERAITPPEHAIRVAKSYFTHQHKRSFASAVMATLLFDSLQAVPAGVRAAAVNSRHLLFGAQSLAIDLHIDPASRPGWFQIAGQIIDKSSPDGPFARAVVAVIEGDLTTDRFETNEFGEFQGTFELRNNVRLQVTLEHQVVSLPLEVLFDPSNPLTSADEE